MRAFVVMLVVAAVAPPHAHADDAGDRWNGGTVGYQLVGGLAGTVAGGGVGAALGYGLGHAIGSGMSAGTQEGFEIFGTAVLGSIGGMIGMVVGVDAVGDWRHSTGRWWGSTLGIAGGVVVLYGLVQILPERAPKALEIATIAVGYAALLGGCVVGYQLSAEAHAPVVPIAAIVF